MKTLFVATFFCFAVASLPAQMTHPEPPPALTVSGQSEVRAAPDLAVVSLGVTRRSEQARNAQQEANQVIRSLMAALQELGIPAEDIQTSELNLNPVYDQRPPAPYEEYREPRIVGYEANYTLSVRLENLELVGPAVDTALDSGANRLNGIQFSLRDDLPFREQALKQAVTEARRKASAIAEALGVSLGTVMEVIEQSGGVQPVYRYARAEMLQAADQSTPVAPGQLSVSGAVTLRYRINLPTP